MPFRLRYLHHDFELPPGRFLIGRSTDCQLSLDDPLVSRKHALLIVTVEAIEVQDLGSRNGVLVNDEKISGPRNIHHGDRITIGSQSMVIAAPPSDAPTVRSFEAIRGGPHVTVTAMEPIRTPLSEAAESRDEGTSKRDAFRLLGGVAEKALVLGRAEEAERLLSTLLDHVMQTARDGADIDESLVDQAGFYAAKLAGATNKGAWVNYVVELYSLRRRPCTAATIDELHTVLRKVKDIDMTALRAYVRVLREEAAKLGPAEKFLVQRIEGLERLVTVQ